MIQPGRHIAEEMCNVGRYMPHPKAVRLPLTLSFPSFVRNFLCPSTFPFSFPFPTLPRE